MKHALTSDYETMLYRVIITFVRVEKALSMGSAQVQINRKEVHD
ncbi:hypothetical protein [Piscibacillus halophilus]|nr:hypothetical protein [Piscibacillus halophilus]